MLGTAARETRLPFESIALTLVCSKRDVYCAAQCAK
jgi:hypothetical protein